ncbi:MAG: class I SAM-dependent methyltransferase [Verrucomicrobia bacterium]|nr:class I SAM-dependent methyltransferase [Verrucomicrobiota bacterium]
MTAARSSLRARWERERFQPGWLGLAVNPFYHARRGIWRELGALAPRLHGELLDVGCGRKPYRSLFGVSRYVGLEVDTPVARELACADAYYDGRRFPFPDASFDCVFCSEVLEHVFTPDDFLGEVRRVLRPHGRLLLTVPFVWDEHEQPVDFARYSSFGLRALLERAGFVIEEQRKSVADARAVAQIASGWLYKATHSRRRWLRLGAQLGLIAPVNALGAVAGLILPDNPDFYLDNVVLATKQERAA